MIRLSACLLLLALMMAGLMPAPSQAQTIDYQRLDQRLTQLAAEEDMIGLAVAVIEAGEITHARGYGVTAEEEGPVTAHTVFRWASLSKGVATSLTALLSQEGHFALDAPLSSFSTSLRLPGGGERQATLEDLMAHRVGVVANAYDTMLEDGRDPADIRRRLGGLKTICPIRECHSYQNVAFDTLTEIIETATGESYAHTVRERLFRPLKMPTASTGRDSLITAHSWAKPYEIKRGATRPTLQTVKEPYYKVPAAGGVNGSILDLARFARAQMGLSPEILPPDVLDVLHTPRVSTPREQLRLNRHYEGRMRDARYGLGWRIYEYDITRTRVVGHRGAVEGYRSLMLFDPELKSGVVALWNTNSRRPVGVELEVMDMIYGLPPKDWLELDTERPAATPG